MKGFILLDGLHGRGRCLLKTNNIILIDEDDPNENEIYIEYTDGNETQTICAEGTLASIELLIMQSQGEIK